MNTPSRAAFEAWVDDYSLRTEPNYSKDTEADCLAAWHGSRKAAMEDAKQAVLDWLRPESEDMRSINDVLKELK